MTKKPRTGCSAAVEALLLRLDAPITAIEIWRRLPVYGKEQITTALQGHQRLGKVRQIRLSSPDADRCCVAWTWVHGAQPQAMRPKACLLAQMWR